MGETGEFKIFTTRENGFLSGRLQLPGTQRDGLSSVLLIFHSPFIAADAKIALSIGQVNLKAQHIVFCFHSGHSPPKSPGFACGNRDLPRSMRV
jgi:hypothetical protein